MKQFRINPQIGSVKHSISYQDGVETHRDGSPFWGIEIFRTKRKLVARANALKKQGYTEV